MSVVYAAAIKTARMEVVRDAIDAGSGAGKLEIGTAGMAQVLATLELADPASSVAGSVLSLLGVPLSVAASLDGVAAAARIRDSDDNNCATGLTVGLAATDIILDSVNFTAGQTVNITGGSITHG